MKYDKTNYLSQTETKDFESWKTEQPYYKMKATYVLEKAYEEYKGDQEQLRKEGIKQVLKCPKCLKMEETEILVLPDHKFKEYYCESCLEKKEEEEKQERIESEKQRIHKEKINRDVEFLNILPPRFEEVISNKNKSSNKELNSICSVYYGGFGTGKTWAAYKIAYDLFSSLKINKYRHITEVGMMNEIKAGFRDSSFDSRVNRFKEEDLLIVDEMGKNNDSDFNKAQVFEILNYRYDWEKKTILICNCEEKEELYTILSPAILDRFRENIIKFGGSSRRYKQKQEDKGAKNE
ncbi:MAG: ATP-binding protein [Proteobacteria bacterium]|nr:ATP-binding protein [Pseudomonadota bacterium]